MSQVIVKNPIIKDQPIPRSDENDTKDLGSTDEIEAESQNVQVDATYSATDSPGYGDLCCCFINPSDNVNEQDSNEDFYALRSLLRLTESITIVQKVEKFETASFWMSGGCCKIETENCYIVKNTENDQVLMLAKEDSWWCLRNPCLCCDCFCWCCHSNCNKRRSFTMKAVTPVEASNDPNLENNSPNHPVLVLRRPCRSDCFPLCLQTVDVYGKTGSFIGSVQQTMELKWYVLPTCGRFDIKNADGEVAYIIRTPCVVTTYCCTEATFVISDVDGNEVGDIVKVHDDLAKEAFTDSDRFIINYPVGCTIKIKAVILAAMFLFDYLFYEN